MRTTWIVIMLILNGSFIVAQSVGQNAVLSGQRLKGIEYGTRSLFLPSGAEAPAANQRSQQCSTRLMTPGVLHRVPQDYSTIQGAIDACSDGDTVLVSEGTYLENIRYRGKAITVASLYLMDADTSHISKTIIDGSGSTNVDSGSVVYFINNEDTTSVLHGFTIQGGSGTKYHFVCMFGNYWVRAGGGIFCNNAGAKISSNVITRNRIVAPVSMGGGVEAFGTQSVYPFIILEGNRIIDNYLRGTSTNAGEWSGSGGADLTGVRAKVISNTFERDTIIARAGSYGGGMTLTSCTYGRWSIADISKNIFQSNYITSESEGSGGAGMEVIWTGDVMIKDNIFEGNIATCSNPNGEAEGGGVRIMDEAVTGCGHKFFIHNQCLKNAVSANGLNCGAGLLLYQTTCTVSRCVFKENAVLGTGAGPNGLIGGGGGIKAASSSFRIENCILANNVSELDGGGLLIVEGNVAGYGTERTLVNCTVVGNRSAGHGGGIAVNQTRTFVSLNNIFWADTAIAGDREIIVAGSIAGVSYCDIQGGYSGFGNIDADPLFVSGDSMFHLSPISTCIEKGVDSIQLANSCYYAPTCDYDGNLRAQPLGTHPDIGAQEEQITTGMKFYLHGQPERFTLEQNYPNPFNPSTTITYELPKSSEVTLTVYDVLGREVSVLVNEKKDAGVHEVKFDGSNFPSGIYFYRIQARTFINTKKLVLLK